MFEGVYASIALAILGAALGSFVGAQVWRLRARQLEEDKRAGEEIPSDEYKRLRKLIRPAKSDRSECLNCHHKLAWYDMVPVFSWLALRGKCRYCRSRIGSMELLVELGLGAAFVLSYIYWPHGLSGGLEWVRFAIWLIACVLMAILFVYDTKWSLLPFGVNVALIAVAAVFLAVGMVASPLGAAEWWSLLAAVIILSGLYFLFSLPGWVGLGDSILGLGLSLFIAKWSGAFLALFLANLIGCIMLIPLAVRGKLSHGARVPFGPLLILGVFITMLWGNYILEFVFYQLIPLSNSLMI